MQTVYYIHFNEAELQEKLEPLKALPVKLLSHATVGEAAKWETLPDLFVISLARLPSHGRQYAQWIWEAKKRQHIPIVFTDGEPEKITATRAKFPRAVYCTSAELPGVIAQLLKQ